MAVIVEQTLPFTKHDLDLEDVSRWTTLLPLIRPSIRAVTINGNQTVLVDQSLANGNDVRIVAVGKAGHFSSKLLESRHVCAVVSEVDGNTKVLARDVTNALAQAGISLGPGCVILRNGNEPSLVVDGEFIEVQVKGNLALDHALHLLGSATSSSRSSLKKTTELLKVYVGTASTAHSTFHVEKEEANPAIIHAEGGLSRGYNQARQAIERDLEHVMQSCTSQAKGTTYSIHYSDVNGLSRLENYILGLEIGMYFENHALPYVLSTSTLLQHEKLARGFAISVCPVPQEYLSPQPQPASPLLHEPAQTSNLTRVDSRFMRFDDATVRAHIQGGCEAVIAAEPTITRYDEIVGDGDCGYTLRDGAKQVLKFVSNKNLGDLPRMLGELVHDLEVNMGGTSGALYCIFLTALAASLTSSDSIAGALQEAMDQLMKYTRARTGDRTMMDCLIPFVKTLVETGDVGKALVEAKKGVDSTANLEAKLGRSTYLDESATKGVPDPGAYGLFILLEGMCQAQSVLE